MRVEFIGQGLSKSNKNTIGNNLHQLITDKRFHTVTIFTAYASLFGIKFILEANNSRVIPLKIMNIYAGIDDGITNKQVLQKILDNNFNGKIVHQISRKKRSICHSKIYLLEGDESISIVTGSANLTKSGLFYNIESAIISSFSRSDNHGMALFKELKNFLQEIDNSIFVIPISQDVIDNLFEDNKKSKNEFEYSKKFIDNASDYFGEAENKRISISDIKNGRFKKRKRFIRRKKSNSFDQDFIDKWDYNFSLLEEFKNKFGKTLVKERDGHRRLYYFTKLIKTLKKKGELPVKYVEKLDSINFTWHSVQRERYRNAWLKNYNDLLDVREEFGTIKLAGLPLDDKVKNLKRWVSRQRTYRHQNNKRLTKFRINKLEEIGFDWKMPAPDMSRRTYDGDDRWLNKLVKLTEYQKKHGDVNPSQSSKDAEIKKLGLWVNVQRVAKKRNTLSSERIDALDDLGFIWDLERFKFSNRIQDLLEYKKLNGDFKVSSSYKGHNSLGNYVYKIRRGKATLATWKIDELNKIGFEFIEDPSVNKKVLLRKDWMEKYDTLVKIKDEEGDVNKPKVDWHNEKIGVWLYRQKRRNEKGLLNKKQILLLEKAGVLWKITSSFEKAWYELYDLAKMFHEEYGHTSVGYKFDRTLSNWVSRQRRDYKLNILSEEKIQLLKDISIL